MTGNRRKPGPTAKKRAIDLPQCIYVLEMHNNWRRGKPGSKPTKPELLGLALDFAVRELKLQLCDKGR